MYTDGNLAELHALASKIGLKREWFQGNKVVPHYDLTANMREKAIKAGAQAVEWRHLAELMKKKREESKAPNVIISYVPYYDMDERDSPMDQAEEHPGWGAFLWDGIRLGERLFASRGHRGYVEQWLAEQGYRATVDGLYRKGA